MSSECLLNLVSKFTLNSAPRDAQLQRIVFEAGETVKLASGSGSAATSRVGGHIRGMRCDLHATNRDDLLLDQQKTSDRVPITSPPNSPGVVSEIGAL